MSEMKLIKVEAFQLKKFGLVKEKNFKLKIHYKGSVIFDLQFIIVVFLRKYLAFLKENYSSILNTINFRFAYSFFP